MRKVIILISLAAVLGVTSGCVYKAAIAQGNLVEQEDLDQAEVGMTRNQIRFLLGTPMIDDPFHHDRWDYIYYLKVGRGDALAKRWVSIIFTDDIVTEIRSNQELSPDI